MRDSIGRYRYRWPFPHTDGPKVGVEVEAEFGLNGPPPEKGFTGGEHWNLKHDGSLRGLSFEAISSSPIATLNQVDRNLRQLKQSLTDQNIILKESERCSVHIHVNVQHLSTSQLYRYMCAYLFIEPLLMHFVEEGRHHNLFCLTSMDSPYLVDRILLSLSSRTVSSLLDDHMRYSSLNLASLRNFGTLEFRLLETPVDNGQLNVDKIVTWVNILIGLQVFAKGSQDLAHLITMSSLPKPKEVFQVLVPTVPLERVCPVKQLASVSLLEGSRIIQDIVFSDGWEDLMNPKDREDEEGLEQLFE